MSHGLKEFEPFAEFFGETLKNGVAFEDDLGVKLVAFHPQFQHQPLSLGSDLIRCMH